MKKVVIYPGRFQPMLSHHVKVYQAIQQMFPNADVYIGTSDKVDPEKSPFNFQEKRLIAKAHGIDPSKVLLAPRPYHNMDYEANFQQMSDQFDPDNVEIFFAVGEKDVGERFPMNNVDEKTGLDMKVRGEPGPKYYQMINTYKRDPQPMSKRGYIAPIDNIVNDMEEVQSASAFRQALRSAPDKESAKQIFTKEFGEMNNSVFELVYNKIAGNKMTEDLNILRKLAGMDVIEDAPVEFETEVNPSKVKFMEPNKSSAQMSIANRFPEGYDPNDKEVKQEQFVQALVKSPASLLSEINERIDPKDENSLQVSDKLSKIIDSLTSRYNDPSLMSLEDDDKNFVMKVVKSAINNMELVAGDDSEPEYQSEPEDNELDKIENPMDKNESLDLNDIRSDYGVDEGKVKDMGMDQAEAFYDKVSELVDDQNNIEKAIVMAWEDSDDNPPEWALDDETRDILVNNGLIEPEMEEPEMEESFDPRAEQSREDQAYEELMGVYDKGGEEALAQELNMSMEDLDDEMSDFARDHNLHMDDDRDEIIQRYVEDLVDNADWKDHGGQDFDPADAEMEESLSKLRKLAGLPEAIMADPEFKYDNSKSYEYNFQDWYRMHQREYEIGNEKYPYSLEQAKEIYDQQHGDKKGKDPQVSMKPDPSAQKIFKKLDVGSNRPN